MLYQKPEHVRFNSDSYFSNGEISSSPLCSGPEPYNKGSDAEALIRGVDPAFNQCGKDPKAEILFSTRLVGSDFNGLFVEASTSDSGVNRFRIAIA